MAGYRAYIVGQDGHFKRSEEFEAADDPSAILRAEDFAATNPVELWQGARRIVVIERRGKPAAIKSLPANADG